MNTAKIYHDSDGARDVEKKTAGMAPLQRFVMCPGIICSVNFALGKALVKLLDWHYRYMDGVIVWHVEDISTGHQDFVGENWLGT